MIILEIQMELRKVRNTKVTMNIIDMILEYCKKYNIQYVVSRDIIKIIK